MEENHLRSVLYNASSRTNAYINKAFFLRTQIIQKLNSAADLREQADFFFFDRGCVASFTCLPFHFNTWWKRQRCHKITVICSDRHDVRCCFITPISDHTNTMEPDMLAAPAHYSLPANLLTHGWKSNGVEWCQVGRQNNWLWRERDY